jgi:hypothetical protein
LTSLRESTISENLAFVTFADTGSKRKKTLHLCGKIAPKSQILKKAKKLSVIKTIRPVTYKKD